jgi:hypothetical protein
LKFYEKLELNSLNRVRNKIEIEVMQDMLEALETVIVFEDQVKRLFDGSQF